MALTLPYPNMNFVPLDILTASEQNHIVANIEYIATQFPITDGALVRTQAGVTTIPSNANLNSLTYLSSGVFLCPSYAVATTLSNSPANTSFNLYTTVINSTSTTPSGNWLNVRQEIKDISGNDFVRYCNTNGSGVWQYGSWYKTTKTAV